jgi:hypothetical protein
MGGSLAGVLGALKEERLESEREPGALADGLMPLGEVLRDATREPTREGASDAGALRNVLIAPRLMYEWVGHSGSWSSERDEVPMVAW